MSGITEILLPKKLSLKSSADISNFLIWKNHILICASMWFFIAAQFGVGGIQSSVLTEGGIGLASLAVYYGFFGLSALIIPQILINKLRLKWTLVLGFFLQFFYIGFNAYPKWYTYIPVSAIGGFGAALAFVCSPYGIRKLCQLYEEKLNASPGSSQGLFFGIFGVFYGLGGVIGYLLIALILRNDEVNKNQINSNVPQLFDYSICGSNFCPTNELPPSSSAKIERIYILIGAFGFCAIISVLIGSLINDIDFSENDKESQKIRQLVRRQIKELKRQVFQTNQLLVIPLNLMNPFLNTIFWADFTRSYAACSAGLDFIGWASMTLNGTSTVFAPIFGKIASKLSIQFVLAIYYVFVLSTGTYMLFWTSNPNSLHLLFILAVLLGLIDSINSPQPRALYGTLFNTEVVFSVFTFLQGVGFLTGFLISQFLCTQIKIYILLGLCGLCILCDLIRNVKNVRKKHNDRYKAEEKTTKL